MEAYLTDPLRVSSTAFGTSGKLGPPLCSTAIRHDAWREHDAEPESGGYVGSSGYEGCGWRLGKEDSRRAATSTSGGN